MGHDLLFGESVIVVTLTMLPPPFFGADFHSLEYWRALKASLLLLTSKNESVQLGAIKLQLEATWDIANFMGLLQDSNSSPVNKTGNAEDLLKQYEEALRQQTGLDFQIIRGPGPLENYSEEENQALLKASEIILKHRADIQESIY